MTKKNLTKKLIDEVNAEIGDTIKVTTNSKTYIGILMPHHEFSDKDIITIKQKNGYNIGVSVNQSTKIKVLEKKGKISKKIKKKIFEKDKTTISVLGTGGTIASFVEYRTGAVHPAISADDLIFSVPEISEICNIRAKVLFSMLSENIKPKHWVKLANEIAKELNGGADGVVVPHGTDTMGYTSSALSFMLKNLNGAVVLLGSQRSSDRPSSDSTLNLLSAVKVAKSDLGEVVVVMHGETSDSFNLIHRGTKVRKMHTSARYAFQSINYKPLGKVEGDKVILNNYKKKSSGKVEVNDKIEENVSLLYFYPGLKSEIFESFANNCKGIVIAGTGLGHVSSEIIDCIKNLTKSGIFVVMTSQCLFGRVNMNVYSGGRDLIKAGVISGEDMLPETAFVKLMWVLGQTKEKEEVEKLMTTSLAGEITERTSFFKKIEIF